MAGGIGGILQQLIAPVNKPQVPPAPFVDPQQAQLQTVSGNTAALPGLEALGSAVNTYNLGQNQRLATSAIPGFANLTGTESANLINLLHGVVPQDVQTNVVNNAAVRALTGGYSGSPEQGAVTASQLGQTSLGLEQAGAQQLPGYLGAMQNLLIPQPYNVQSGFLTPGQDIAAQQWNQENQFNTQWLQNRLNALPDPTMAAVGAFVGDTTNQLVNAGESYLSGGMVSGIGTGGSTGGGGFSLGSLLNLIGQNNSNPYGGSFAMDSSGNPMIPTI